MKRNLLIIISLFIGLVSMAKAPNLNVEKLFDGSYNTDKSVTITISKTKDKYFRGISVRNNPALVKKITELFKKDSEIADETQDIIKNGGLSYSSMTIVNNDLEINIGLSYSIEDGCYLYISGANEAFK